MLKLVFELLFPRMNDLKEYVISLIGYSSVCGLGNFQVFLFPFSSTEFWPLQLNFRVNSECGLNACLVSTSGSCPSKTSGCSTWIGLCVFVFIKKVAVYSQIDFSVTKIQKKKLIKALKKKLVCLMLNKYILGLNIHWYDLKFLLCSWEIFKFDSFRRPNYSCFGAYLVLALLTLGSLHFFNLFFFISS